METGQPGLKYPGEKIIIGTTEYVVPSLSTKQARQYWKVISDTNVDPGAMEKRWEEMVAIIHAALKHNYEDLSAEKVDEDMRQTQLLPAWMGVLKASGFSAGGAEPVAPGAAET